MTSNVGLRSGRIMSTSGSSADEAPVDSSGTGPPEISWDLRFVARTISNQKQQTMSFGDHCKSEQGLRIQIQKKLFAHEIPVV